MKCLFDEDKLRSIYEDNYQIAQKKLKEVPVFCGCEPTFKGLAGWVFEQTIEHCLRQELRALNIEVAIKEESSVGSRSKADLQLGRIVIELKKTGMFSPESFDKYLDYRRKAEKAGFSYLFLSKQETYDPYRKKALEVFGVENTFYLDTDGDWERFIARVVTLLKENP